MPKQIALSPFCTFFVTVDKPIRLGTGGFGETRIIPLTGGTVEGEELRGRILPGGSDEQMIREDGLTRLHARYVIETHDGALVRVDSQGLRSGPPEVMAALMRGEKIDQDQIYFVTTIRLDTADARYDFLNQRLFLSQGIREPDCVRLTLFRVQ
ncbi:MAG: hypothetical protein RLZZ444_504 [Pseudomonadota bacterium]